MAQTKVQTSWKQARLGDYISIKHGFAFKGEHFTEQENANILLSPGNFNIGGGFKGDKFKYYNGKIPEDYVLKSDDLIVTMTDLSKEGDTLGYPAKIPQSNGRKYLHNQRLGLVQFKSSEIDKDFLYYLMCTNNYQQSIVNSATGSTVRHTSPARIESYEFLLPPLLEQRAIAAMLTALDYKIDLLGRQNETLEALAQGLFKEWFVDFNFPDEQGRPYKKNGGKMVGSTLGEIPKEWKIGKLGEITEIKGGTTPSTANPDFWNGDICWTSPKDLSDFKGMFLKDTKSKITPAGLEQIGSGLLPLGTVLLSSRAPIGYLAITIVPLAINQGYIAIVPEEDYKNYFVYLWLKQNMKHIVSAANGSTFLEISKSSFRNIEILIPQIQVVENFLKIVEPIFNKILNNEAQVQNLSTLRDALLPRLMRGEVRAQNNH